MNLKELFRRKEPWDYVTEYTQRMEPVQAPGELPDLVGAVYGRQERIANNPYYNDMRPDPGWGCGTLSMLGRIDGSHIANGCITVNKIAGPTYRKCLFCGSNVEGRGNCPRCGAPES